MDTAAVVAAMRSPTGASAAIVRAVRQRQATLLLAERQVEIFVDAIIAMGEPVLTHFLWRPQLHDPNDEMVLEAAINGRADAIVTFNVRDFGTAASQFGGEGLLPRQVIARIKR